MAKEKSIPGKTTQKRRMLIGIAIFTLIGALSFFLLQHPEWFTRNTSGGNTMMYSDKLVSYLFYETNYDLDVTADATYMGLDRYIHVQRGAENFAVTDGNYAAWGEAVSLIAQYIETAIAGDTDAHNALYSAAYYKTNDPHERFAPQMIYGIQLEELSRTESAAGDSYIYNVTYAIYRNDGSFRNDIDSNAFKTLIFYLAPEDGTLKIDAIDYYRTRS